ncbi:MAG TPA: hypothetical protein OIM64_05220 [Bacilli bacterium]|nr:hypothetical protein [Bacilli bacterium]
MENNKGLIIGIIGLIIVMIGGTYAYYRWNSTSNINVSVKISGNTVTFVGGSNVTGTLTPVDSKEEGIKKDITVKASEAGSTMSLYMELTTMPSELKEESFVYELYYNDTTLVKKGNFKAYNASSNANGITYASSGVTTLTLFTDRNVNTTTDKYTLYLWFNGKDFTNPNTMQNKTLSFDLYATGKNATLNG